MHKLYFFEHLQKLSITNFEIDEVTTSVLLSMGTSIIAESTTSLNPKIFAEDLRCYQNSYIHALSLGSADSSAAGFVI